MDNNRDRLLRYYERELFHLRETAGQFAKDYPKIAGRLGLEALECADPYVERLLEGFAFLTARVQLKLDAQFPRLTHSILETIYPNYVSPTPSMALVKFEPDLAEGSLSEGFTIPRGSVLRSRLGKGDQTPCEYRTAHETTLWPLEVSEAQYLGHVGGAQLPAEALARVASQSRATPRAALRLRLRTVSTVPFHKLGGFDRLDCFVHGAGNTAGQLLEHILTGVVGVVVLPAAEPAKREKSAWWELLPASTIRQRGFEDDEALLPAGNRSFHGYRLLHEYFSFPQRYRYVELSGLSVAARRHKGSELDVFVLLDESRDDLERRVDASYLVPFTTPAVNLFPKRADRIHLNDRFSEFHVVADRTRPLDYEIYRVLSVTGFGQRSQAEQEFLPFYSATSARPDRDDLAYFSVHRVPRSLTQIERRRGPRSKYLGSEVFLSLVDAQEAPYRSDLRQLGVETLATNRDLPLHMPVGSGATDFTLDSGAPVLACRCLEGPTSPRPSHVTGEIAWRLVSHLSLNYLSLINSAPGSGASVEEGRREDRGAEALRDLLKLYVDLAAPDLRKQVEGLRSISVEPIVRRLPRAWPVSFVRGLEVTAVFSEPAFEGVGVYLLGAVLDRFLAKYVSINSFTEGVIRTQERGEVARFPARIGERHVL